MRATYPKPAKDVSGEIDDRNVRGEVKILMFEFGEAKIPDF